MKKILLIPLIMLLLASLVLGASLNVTLKNPTSAVWNTSTSGSDLDIDFGFTVNGSCSVYTCDLYSSFAYNGSALVENASWETDVAPRISVLNSTNVSDSDYYRYWYDVRLPETDSNGYNWNVYCFCQNKSSTNTTAQGNVTALFHEWVGLGLWTDDTDITCTWAGNNSNTSIVLSGTNDYFCDTQDGFYLNNLAWNNTRVLVNYTYLKLDSNWGAANRTNYVDLSAPTVTKDYPTSSYSTSATVTFGATGTDNNLEKCSLWTNASGTWAINESKSFTTATQTNFTAVPGLSGNILYNVVCNDSASRDIWASPSSNYSITIDTSTGVITNNTNGTSFGLGLGYWFAWDTGEAGTCSLSWGDTSSTAGGSTSGSATSNACNLTASGLTAPNYDNTTLYVNISFTDTSGNINTSTGNIVTDHIIDSSWRGFMVGEAKNLGNFSLDSGSDYVYVWNASQEWLDNINDPDYDLSIGDAVLVYDSPGVFWDRNETGVADYNMTLAAGWNLYGVGVAHPFYNLSLNSTGGSASAMFNSSYTFFGYVNNSNSGAVIPYYFNDTWSNTTTMTAGHAIWIYAAWADTRDWTGGS